MSIVETKYRLSTDPNGLAVIEVSGRCTGDEAAAIEANCTRVFQMVRIPQARGAILKALDGTVPRIVEVEPSTLTSRRYRCVKVDGRCNPLAPAQTGGPYSASTILSYYVRYQEVGGVS